MTNKNDDYNYSLDFFGKECKNNCHNQCESHWEGLGFQVYCNCECHREYVLGRDESLTNTINLPSNRSSKEDE